MIRASLILGSSVLIICSQICAADSLNKMTPLRPKALPDKVLTPGALPPAPLTVNKLFQRDIIDSKGDKIAKLDELVMDDGGEVRYAILSYGGLLDVGEQHVLVPWRILRVSSDPTTITLDLSPDVLKRAPRIDRSLDKQDWRNLEGINWQDVDRFYIRLYASRGDGASRNKEFHLLDYNRDRYISRKEAGQIPALSKAFKRVDANHDGRLDQGEFARFEVSDTPSSQHHSGEVQKTFPAEKQQNKSGD